MDQGLLGHEGRSHRLIDACLSRACAVMRGVRWIGTDHRGAPDGHHCTRSGRGCLASFVPPPLRSTFHCRWLAVLCRASRPPSLIDW